MTPLQIGILVGILLTFFLALSIIIYCSYRYGLLFFFKFGGRRSSPTLFYFYDFQKRLQCFDLAPHLNGEININHHAIELDTVECNRDVISAESVYEPAVFLSCLGRMLGVSDITTLAISRVDEGNIPVEIDLYKFLAPGVRNGNIENTAMYPCYISRHFSFIPSDQKTGGRSSLPQEIITFNNNSNNNNSNNSRQLPGNKQVLFPPLILPVNRHISTGNAILISTAQFFYVNDSNHVVDENNIPIASYISKSHQNNGEYIYRVSNEIAERIEEVFIRNDFSGRECTVAVSKGLTAKVNPSAQSAVLYFTRDRHMRCRRFVYSPGQCKYGIMDYTLGTEGMSNNNNNNGRGMRITYSYDDGMGERQRVYKGPFYLPAGRWCLCVKVYLNDNYSNRWRGYMGEDNCDECQSQSRVYTVESQL